MSEMIERVLKAIQREDDPPISDVSHPQKFSPPNAREDRQRRMARAAIQAMRVPTEPMLKAIYDLEQYAIGGHAWQAAIDAALSEEPKDITVRCKCGWRGCQSNLDGNNCPTCA